MLNKDTSNTLEVKEEVEQKLAELKEECGIEIKEETLRRKAGINRHRRTKYNQRKLRQLQQVTWWAVNDKEDYLLRSYTPRKKIYKRTSNKQLRKYRRPVSNGSNYKKLYDLKWEIW